MNTGNQMKTQNIAVNVSTRNFEIVPGHGPEAVLWVVADALLLVTIVTGNSLSVAIILRTRRRRQRSEKSTISESTHASNPTFATRKQHSNNEIGMHSSEHERNGPDITPLSCWKPAARSSFRFVLSLAISDLLVGLAMPFHMAFYIQGADGGGSPLMLEKEAFTLGQIKWTCLLRFVLIALACSASACNLLAIAVDRYLAIVYPLHYCRYMTKRVAIAMIVSCWGTALVFATVPAYWNNWATASLCELDEILTPEYMIFVVAPLFGAVVAALSILYWRIGKEARAQLSRLLGADGKGPPWRRRLSGKTYCSTVSFPEGEGENNSIITQRQTNIETDPMKLTETETTNKTPEYLKKEKWKYRESTQENVGNLSVDKSDKLFDSKGKDFESFKRLNIQSSDNNAAPYSNTIKEDANEIHSLKLKETGEIFKCKSDPNLAISLMEDESKNCNKTNREIIPYKKLTECKTKSKSYNNICPLKIFLKDCKKTARKSLVGSFNESNSEDKCSSEAMPSQDFKNINEKNYFPKNQLTCSNMEFKEMNDRTENWIELKMLSERQTTNPMANSTGLNNFHTMPNTLITNFNKINKQRELIISVESLQGEPTTKQNISINEEKDKKKNCTTADGPLQEKSISLREESILENKLKQTSKGTSKEIDNYAKETKPNDLNLERCCSFLNGQDDQHQIKNKKGSLKKGHDDIRECENGAVVLDNDDCRDFPHKRETKELHGNQHHNSRIRTISSSSSSHGGHRNSTWNIRFPSLTSGSTSMRPHISKSTIVVLLVLGSYVLLWLPFITVSSLLLKGVKLPYMIYRLTFSLAMSNSGVNPIIYGWKNAELKRVFLRFLMNRWHQCTSKWKNRTQEQVPGTGTQNDFLETTEASCIS